MVAHTGIPNLVWEYVGIEGKFDAVLVDHTQGARLRSGCLNDGIERSFVSRRAVDFVGLSDTIGSGGDLELGFHVVLRRTDVNLDAFDVSIEVVVFDHATSLHNVAVGGVRFLGDSVVGRDHSSVVNGSIDGHLLRGRVEKAKGFGMLGRFDDAINGS